MALGGVFLWPFSGLLRLAMRESQAVIRSLLTSWRPDLAGRCTGGSLSRRGGKKKKGKKKKKKGVVGKLDPLGHLATIHNVGFNILILRRV